MPTFTDPMTFDEVEQARMNEGGIFCNNCAAKIDFPVRGLIPFDGRFCDQICKNGFEFKRAKYIMRKL